MCNKNQFYHYWVEIKVKSEYRIREKILFRISMFKQTLRDKTENKFTKQLKLSSNFKQTMRFWKASLSS